MNNNHFKKEEYVYKDAQIKMSKTKMADFLYAVIMCHAEIATTWGIGIYQYNRRQNVNNLVAIKLHIHPSYIQQFEELSGVKLVEPRSVYLNSANYEQITHNRRTL